MKRIATTAAPVKSPAAMLKVVAKAKGDLAKVRKAMDDVIQGTAKLPGMFRTDLHSGGINNLENPKEYAIWVGIENVKALYALNEAYKDTLRDFAHLEKLLQAYK